MEKSEELHQHKKKMHFEHGQLWKNRTFEIKKLMMEDNYTDKMYT